MLLVQQKHQRLNPLQAYLLLTLTLICFVCVKLPYISLPYYWDEAWVYAPAIQVMHKLGASFAPDALPVDYGRGHPLLFHFLGSIWLTVFGYSIISLHTFALTLSVLTLLVIYHIVTHLFYRSTGLVAVILIILQSVFFAQSVLVLPEVLLLLFLLLALHYYVRKKWIGYGLSAAAAILTKESGIVLFIALSIHTAWQGFKDRKNYSLYLTQLFYINLPASAWIGFLIWQKAIRGWYFFPFHVGLISFQPDVIGDKLQRIIAYIFIYRGRNILLISTVIAFLIIRKRWKIDLLKRKWFVITALFFLVFIAMSSVNFYVERYVMVLIVLFVIASAVILTRPELPRWLAVLCFISTVGGSVDAYINQTDTTDHNRGYADAIRIMQQTTSYFTSPALRHERIYCSFIFMTILSDTLCGYVTPDNRLLSATNSDTAGATIFVLSNFDAEITLDFNHPEKNRLVPIQTFSSGKAKIKICRRSPL
jgi:4-amino-4-deoxy-L-arabinose transferase-like glycosyltransferase